VKEGGEVMEHLQQTKKAFPDESTLRVWEDMRSEVLHELQEGAEVSDTLIDSIAELAARLGRWRSAGRLQLTNTATPLQNA
jgi:hypothetical protein